MLLKKKKTLFKKIENLPQQLSRVFDYEMISFIYILSFSKNTSHMTVNTDEKNKLNINIAISLSSKTLIKRSFLITL